MRRIVIVLFAIAMLVAACGSASDDGVATLDDGSGTSDEVGDVTAAADDEARLLAFAACMRENGVEDFPDPQLNADGSVDFGVADERPLAEVDDATAEAAFNACIGELEGAAFAPGGADFDLTDLQDRLVAFAACMRDEGIDFDDPDLGDVFGEDGITNPFADLDVEDPDVLAAIEVCQDVFTGFGPFTDG